MIFVCVGSREYQFNRLFEKLDELVQENRIQDQVFAQIGNSDYIPKHYEFERFLSSEQFLDYQKKADLIISHGGTGALVNALKLGKKIIIVPRLSKYNEHTDDHQLQVSNMLYDKNYVCAVVLEMNDLYKAIVTCNSINVEKFNIESNVLGLIFKYLKNNTK